MMTQCPSPSDVPLQAAMDGITAQDYLENPELKIYVEDALRLALAARPETPLDLINDYLQSVLCQDNVVGREFSYINATVRNRRAFVRAVYEVFVDHRNDATKGCGFEQVDVVHLFGLVCPDFPEDLVARVARLLSNGSRHVNNVAAETTAAASTAVSTAATAVPPGPSTELGDLNDGTESGDFKSIPFEVFLRACSVYFCFQEFFEDVQELFGVFSCRANGGGRANNIRGGSRGDNAKGKVPREVNLRMLLDQLQVMKAEPRNQLRYVDVRHTEAAARKGGLGERVTLPAFMECLLLNLDEVAQSLLEAVPLDGYAERLEACPALWNDGRLVSPPSSSGDGADAAVGTPGRRKRGSRKGRLALGGGRPD